MITKKEVEHIAKLARVELTDAEVEKYEKELSAVLGFVDKLAKVDTTNIEPLTGGTELANVMRDDTVNKELGITNNGIETAAELVGAAPLHKNGYIKVPKVFE
jgi:aspartyl-tRNA(Asn)/glutamyl-tRNA(Gln) amidotransferase subunit C